MTWRQHKAGQQTLDRMYLSSLMDAAGGSPGQAAKLAGVNRTAFFRMLRRHELLITTERQLKTIAGRREQMRSEREART